MADLIDIEVAYAMLNKQKILGFKAMRGISALDAIKASNIQAEFPEIELDQAKIGIFGKITKPGTVLKAGDRVEIYRQLIADPKEIRKQRTAAGKSMRKGGNTTEN